MKSLLPLYGLIAALLVLSLAYYTLDKSPQTARQNERSFVGAEQNQRGDRLAFVIGNKDYAQKPLENPVNDARDMKAALEQVGFRAIYRENASKL